MYSHKIRLGDPEHSIMKLKRKIAVSLAKKRLQKKMDQAEFVHPRYDDIYFEGIEWLNKHG